MMTTTALDHARGPSVFSEAARTVVYLSGGFIVAMALASAVGTPSEPFEVVRNVTAGIVALACLSAAAAAWARDLALRAGSTETHRAAWAGALGFGPAVLVVGLALTALEPHVVTRPRLALPLHVVYGLLFVPSAAIVAGVCAWSLTIALRLTPAKRRRVTLATALAALGAYLAVYLVMELAGWRVGAPGAGRRATMVVVTALAALAATAAGGATLGARLSGGR